ncbi:hypothetical protein Tco_0514419 [Tanacetum coccineum]
MPWLRIKKGSQIGHVTSCAKATLSNLYHGPTKITQEESKCHTDGSSNSDIDKIMSRMDAMTMKMDAQYKDFQSHSKQSNLDDDDIPMSREEEAKFTKLSVKSGRPSGSLPSNTQPNPKGCSSKPYQPPQARNEHVNAIFTRSCKSYDPPDNPNDQQNNSETPINFDSDDEDDEPTPQPKPKTPTPVKETVKPKPYKPKIPYPQRLRIEKNAKLWQISKRTRKNNKTQIEPNHSSCSYDESFTILQNKVPPKLEDPGSFLIPCNFNKAFSCNDLADLGASMNLIPIDIIDEILKEDFDALLNEGSEILHSIEGTILEEKLFAELDEFMAMTVDENSEFESDTEEPPFEKITFNIDYKIKTSIEEPPTDLELKPLPDNLEYVFLEEPSFHPVIISS